jgi:hypothetical protein
MRAVVRALSIAVLGACTHEAVVGTDDAGVDASTDVQLADGPQFLDGGPYTASCSASMIAVTIGAHTPTVTCTSSVPVQWNVDRGEIGSPSTGSAYTTSTTFVPSGTAGGVADVLAGSQVAIPILVQLSGSSSGNCPPSQVASSTTQLTAGGGVGGVGGEGCGGAVTDAPTLAALSNPVNNSSLAWLYPYDKTVFPRGLLAPLLQWSWTMNDADAIQIQLSTVSGSFSWTGTFARPSILSQTSGAFIRHPIPQDVWAMATNTAGTKINGQRDDLTVKLVVARNGVGYGPISETWVVAPGRLSGTVYYGSYGTAYVQNGNCKVNFGNGPGCGGATLAIQPGTTSAPTIIAGSNSECRVCHQVSADGSTLHVMHEDYSSASTYDLKNNDVQTSLATPSCAYQWMWPALSPDGKLIFSSGWPTTCSPTALYTTPAGGAASATGIPSALAAWGSAASPDGKHYAFTDLGKDQRSLAMMDFASSAHTFSGYAVLDTPPTLPAVFPSFLPTNTALVYERIIQAPSSASSYLDQYAYTWNGAKGEIWWTTTSTPTPARLDQLDGANYLPAGPNNHANDTELNYAPTSVPLAIGGYAWVVFTSRRMYGNVATIDPWQSDPRNYDATVAITTKKLWVAAVDLDATAGTDPSHPAFYLPAQELMAGNFHGHWALEPCRQDGQSCATGDQCCGRYCESNGDGGLACGSTPPTCGGEGDSCVSNTQCCSGLQCVGGPDNGHCDVTPIK